MSSLSPTDRPLEFEGDRLATPVQYLKGAGPKRAELLANLNLHTVLDVLLYVPRDVLDLTEVRHPTELTGTEVETVRGRVVDFDARSVGRGRTLTGILIDCGDGEYVRGTWFNQPWMRKKFQPGQFVLFSGKPKRFNGRWEFSHPQTQLLGEEDSGDGGVRPRYGLTAGLSMDALRTMCRSAATEYAPLVVDPLPEAYRQELKLPSLADAVRSLHLPDTVEQFETAKHRVLFDDLFEFQLALALRRRAWRADDAAPRLLATAKIDARIRRLFPFEFTAGQNTAIRDIAVDLASGRAMHRLLQADVGAGKTVVALYAMLTAIAHGYQAAIMAPTEVLANQHWATVNHALKHSRVERQLLTGRLTAARRKRLLSRIAAGEVDLVIGTQALIQEGVQFAKLGVAVVDEQHKFGVAQRAGLGAQGVSFEHIENADPRFEPEFSATSQLRRSTRSHVLVMTATPIPRSLCLTSFGDLDLTAIKDLPPGRQKVITSRITGSEGRKKAWGFIRNHLATGRQAYVICPRVEERPEDRDDEISGSVEAVYRQLTENELNGHAVGLVHGRMAAEAKDAAMEAFRNRETAVLVSTTVVEVGVDVPNATLMVIYQAERFGLSQLHQLRGRIARGKHQGYCFLLTAEQGDDAASRLAVLERTSDGFEIAEADFDFRGPGDALGVRQSGQSSLRYGDSQWDANFMQEVRQHATSLVESGRIDDPEFVLLKTRVLERFAHVTQLPKTG